MPFQPGESGNPGGRPKGESKVREAARLYTDAAMAVLVDALGDEDMRVAIKAAETILDRGWGRPPQAVVGDSDYDPIQTAIRVLFGK